MLVLKSAIEKIGPISNEAWQEIEKIIATRKLAKGDFFLHSADIAIDCCFIKEGIMREYYLDEHGNETTRRFCKAGEFSGSLKDIISGKPSVTSICAVTDCELLVAPWAAIDALSENDISMMRIMRRVAELHYLRKSEREHEMLALDAIQRLEKFATDEPDLAHILPRNLIASYLGISEVHLSRLRGREKLRQSQPVKR